MMARTDFETYLSSLQELTRQKVAFAMVTLVQVLGSCPQTAGARILVGRKGLIHGTIGGGALEKRAIELAIESLETSNPEPKLVPLKLQQDLKMVCGGNATLFVEPHLPEGIWKIAVFGAGHVAQELIRTLLRLDCEVICIDPRPEWLAQLPQNRRLETHCLENMSDAVTNLDPRSFVAVMTMGHRTDLPIVESLLRIDFPYIGVIGSATKAHALKAALLERNIPMEKIERINCPIGEPFGNHSPPEIALSIAAQLLKKRDINLV